MSALWITVVAVALAGVVIKATGPVLLGSKELPSWASSVIAVLAPALLAALVVTGTFGEDGRLVLDARAAGIAVAAIALWLRAPVLLAVALAALTTAVVRSLG